MFDEQKIMALYHELGRELFTYLYRLIGNRESAEDILHDLFVNLINYSHKREVREETVRTFLYRSAHNLAINHLKKNRRYETHPIEELALQAPDNDPQARLDSEEANRLIEKMLSGADPVTRSVFIMQKELRLKISDIAEKVGVSERTVKRKLQKFLEDLSDELGKAGFRIFCPFILALILVKIVQLLGVL